MTTRREQIVNAWGAMPAGLSRASFIQGAEWADANPLPTTLAPITAEMFIQAFLKAGFSKKEVMKMVFDAQNELKTRDQAIELARDAVENAKWHFEYAGCLRVRFEQKEKCIAGASISCDNCWGTEKMVKALTAIDNLLKGQK